MIVNIFFVITDASYQGVLLNHGATFITGDLSQSLSLSLSITLSLSLTLTLSSLSRSLSLLSPLSLSSLSRSSLSLSFSSFSSLFHSSFYCLDKKNRIMSLQYKLIMCSRSTVVALWTVGKQASELILCLRHDSYQNSLISKGYPRPSRGL